MKRFVTTLVAWLILLSITYFARFLIAGAFSETAIRYWQLEAFLLHYVVSPIIFLATWGLYIKHRGDERYNNAVRVMAPFPAMAPNVYVKPKSEEVSSRE